ISHDLISVERLCGRLLLLNHGQVIASGPTREVIGIYQEIGRTRRASEEHQAIADVPRSREIEITSVRCEDEQGHVTSVLRTGDAVRVRVEYVGCRPVSNAMFELFVYSTQQGLYGPWCHLTTAANDSEPMSIEQGPGFVEFEIDELSLLPGTCH